MEVAEAKVKVDSPGLRFSGIKGAWREHRLDEVCEKIQDGTHFSPPLLDDGPYKYISARNIRNGEMLLNDMLYVSEAEHREIYKRSDVRFGDVLLTKDGASTGNVCLNELDEEFSLLSSVAFIRGDNVNASSEFIYQYLFSPFGQREVKAAIAGQAITRITLEKLRGFKFRFPTLPEQQKIAAFLGAVDRKIQQLKRKQELLERYKQGVVQQLFSQELRFKKKDGSNYPDWQEKPMSYFLVERNVKAPKSDRYPLMSFVAYEGVTPKSERYDREFLVNDGTGKPYKQTELGDFIYSSNNLETGSIGLNNHGPASISPVYSIFQVKETCHLRFISEYLIRRSFLNKMVMYRQGVVYGQWRIHESDFLSIREKMPSLEEQSRIAGFLMALDAKVAGVAQAVAAAQKWKRGLLQQMFV